MAEKKYYWLKLSEKFFQDKSIKKLRKLAGGDTYTIIYLKMLLKAISNDNKLYFEGVEDNFADELALDIDEDPDNVLVTINYLQNAGLIEIVDEDEFELLQCKEMIGSETDSARKRRAQRERKRQKELKAAQELPEIEEKPQEKSKETQLQMFERLTAGSSMSNAVREEMRAWLKYKSQKKDTYVETGLKSLIKKVERMTEEYGDQAVIDLIETCMSSNWKGIIWDKIEEKSGSSISDRVSMVDKW